MAMCLRWPGLRALLVRRSYGELKGNHLEAMLEEYEVQAEIAERDIKAFIDKLNEKGLID